jgi:large subunit ribosomal protein L8e
MSNVNYYFRKELFVAVEGMYTGQFIYCGKKAQLNIGNVMPIGKTNSTLPICPP